MKGVVAGSEGWYDDLELVYNVTGLDENIANASLNVYSTDQTIVVDMQKFGAGEVFNLEVYNVAGQLILSDQAISGYTFLFGGILMKGCELIATGINKKYLAIAMSVLIPSSITLILTFIMHNMKGTPRPLESTLPTLIIIPATAILGYMKRKEYDTAENSLVFHTAG